MLYIMLYFVKYDVFENGLLAEVGRLLLNYVTANHKGAMTHSCFVVSPVLASTAG